ncbi:MAG: hypothetical protein ACI8P3_003083 [Saprospiraceae bacterium]|jgi:hypothetical protein
MKPEDQSEMIEEYLFNRMDEEERVKFELLFRDDPALFEEVKSQKALLEMASDENFQKIFPLLKAQDKAYTESLLRSNKKKIFLVLLLFLFLIFLYFISQY